MRMSAGESSGRLDRSDTFEISKLETFRLAENEASVDRDE